MKAAAPRAPWRAALVFSIKGRMVALFVLLALATTAVFLFGMQRVLHTGWQDYVQPLAADYVDRLAADIGTPPEPARALGVSETTVRNYLDILEGTFLIRTLPPPLRYPLFSISDYAAG